MLTEIHMYIFLINGVNIIIYWVPGLIGTADNRSPNNEGPTVL